ncbi:hypothetical protein FA95DRAFT_139176 [Auriscalpium vulgare]|uniref:Uncharacterized protein n=1 Tax=Auriscalpium vulgare TaxID=40419 RepID=A0ACB8S798_9AGAM|nr:hypothetical protein FA95DRAFT_139176 [Auriscalpium vulgare]
MRRTNLQSCYNGGAPTVRPLVCQASFHHDHARLALSICLFSSRHRSSPTRPRSRTQILACFLRCRPPFRQSPCPFNETKENSNWNDATESAVRNNTPCFKTTKPVNVSPRVDHDPDAAYDHQGVIRRAGRDREGQGQPEGVRDRPRQEVRAINASLALLSTRLLAASMRIRRTIRHRINV